MSPFTGVADRVKSTTGKLRVRVRSAGTRRRFRRNLSRLRRQYQEPQLTNVVSQLATAAQLRSATYKAWCTALGLQPTCYRKHWEFAWILQALHEADMLREGRRGLGFGVGTEPLAAFMATQGCSLVATDAPSALVPDWAASGQHAAELRTLNAKGLCPAEIFAARTKFRLVDMNDVPGDLRGFDFCWSACAFEHLGTLDRGLDFVERSLESIRPGGIAVHTTEFNLSSNEETVTSGPTVLYRQRDIEAFGQRLHAAGHQIELNFHPGGDPMDRHVDLPPYNLDRHVKLLTDGYVSTSIGLLIRKGRADVPASSRLHRP